MLRWLSDEDQDQDAPSSSTPPAAPDPLDNLPLGPTAAARRIVNIFGKSGEGKTTFMAGMYQGAIARGIRCTWIDTTGNNTYLARAGRSSGYLCAVVRTVEGWAATVRRALQEARPFNVVLVPECDVSPLFAMAYDTGNMLLAIDEAEAYAPATARVENKPIGKLLSQGRNRQVSMFSTVRLPPELHGRFKGNADVTISFAQEQRAYADTIASECMHAFGADREKLTRMLLRLPKFNYLRYSERGLTRGVAPRPGSLTVR